MKTCTRILTLSMLAIFGPLIATAQSDEPIGPTKPVVVVNTPANPVPVSGQINIGNMPAVDARQSGPWNVGILGTPTVKLDPTANLVTVTGKLTQSIAGTGEFDVSTGGYPGIGPFNVAGYARVRIVAYNRSDSAGMFYIIPEVLAGGIRMNLDEAGWIPLAPGKVFSRTYDVPGTTLYVGVAGNGTGRVGAIAVFGN